MPTTIDDNPAGTQRRRSLRSTVAPLFRRRGPAALLDQVLVSACNFLSGVVLVRGLGLATFGKYTIAYAILLYTNSLQLSFVSAPMLTITPLLRQPERKAFLEGMYAVQGLSSLILTIAALAAGGICRLFTTWYDASAILSFAFCVGTYQLQDWLRRYYFVERKGARAIATDVISYLGQLALLVVLWKGRSLTLATAFVAIGVTSLAGFALGPMTDRLRFSTRHLLEAWSKCRTLSRDLLIANQVRWLGVQGILLAGTGFVGTAAIGGLRASQNMTGPINLALLSLENVIPSRLAEELHRHGASGLYRSVRRTTVTGMLLFVAILCPLALFGKPLLRVFYGPETVAYYVPMLIQLVNMGLATVARMCFYFFRALQETKAMLYANGFSALLSVLSVFPFAHFLHAVGVVLASTVAQSTLIVISLWQWRLHRSRILGNNPPRREADDRSFAAESAGGARAHS